MKRNIVVRMRHPPLTSSSNSLLKLITDSSSWNKGNHDGYGVWISDIIIHWTRYLFSDWPKAYSDFPNRRPWRHNCRFFNNHVWPRCMISKRNHVKFARFCAARHQWRSKNMTLISSVQCIIKNNRGLDNGYQPQPSASADNPYLDFDYSGYHKNLIQ